MRAIGLIVRGQSEHAAKRASQAAQWMRKAGIRPLAEESALSALQGVAEPLTAEDPPEMLLCLGGDGTILRGVQYAATCQIPLMGLNMGRIGFLAESEPVLFEKALDQLQAGDYTIEERSLVKVTLPDGTVRFGLNDAVISRGGYSRLVTVEATVAGSLCGRYWGDGVVIATPTGSTGYSLSAGGPIVAPGVEALVITPICAHSLQHRPVLVPPSAEITLLMSEKTQEAVVEVDGQWCCNLASQEKITLRMAEKKLQLLRLQEMDFFHLVHEKLSEWSR